MYGLENFSLEQAENFIQRQTANSPNQFDQDLVQRIVQDLSQPWNGISPLELQLVGCQLQVREITTLSQYQQLGKNPQQFLLNQYIDGIIEDCYGQNERTVISVLYALTDEMNSRPIKTHSALQAELEINSEKLDRVLEILVENGVVFLLPDIPDDRYQLTHDYLVTLIRHQSGERRVTELELDRNRAQRHLLAENPKSLINRAISSMLRWAKIN
ncbi:MAG: hypothetical protein HC835_08165 [Oscillatoriales cyanobacterium RM2_1_1]|nr:hypothetical protein [Oscillatoriales cyanobacterium RM2_1_1]